MGNKNRNRVKKSISPFVKWGKWGGDGVKAFVYAIIFTIVGSDGTSYNNPWHGTLQAFAESRSLADFVCSPVDLYDGGIWRYGRDEQFGIQGGFYVWHAAYGTDDEADL